MEQYDKYFYRNINPGRVFDLTLPLDQVAEGYRATDKCRTIETLMRRQAIVLPEV